MQTRYRKLGEYLTLGVTGDSSPQTGLAVGVEPVLGPDTTIGSTLPSTFGLPILQQFELNTDQLDLGFANNHY